MGETDRLAILSIQEEIKRDRAKERELRERRKQTEQALHQILNTKCILSSEETRGQQIGEKEGEVDISVRDTATSRITGVGSVKQARFVSQEREARQQYTIFKEGGPGYTKYIVYTADSSDRKPGLSEISPGEEPSKPPSQNIIKRHKSLPPKCRRKSGLDVSESGGGVKGARSYYYGDSDTDNRTAEMNGRTPASQRERKAKDAINAELQEMYRREKEHKKLQTRIRQEQKMK